MTERWPMSDTLSGPDGTQSPDPLPVLPDALTGPAAVARPAADVARRPGEGPEGTRDPRAAHPADSAASAAPAGRAAPAGPGAPAGPVGPPPLPDPAQMHSAIAAALGGPTPAAPTPSSARVPAVSSSARVPAVSPQLPTRRGGPGPLVPRAAPGQQHRVARTGAVGPVSPRAGDRAATGSGASESGEPARTGCVLALIVVAVLVMIAVLAVHSAVGEVMSP